MGKGLDTGKAFFQGILAKITDPDAKAAAEKLLGNETVLTEIGNGVEGQAEIDRQLQAARTQQEELTRLAGELDSREAGLATWHGELQTWYTANKDRLATVKPNGDPAPKKEPVPAGLNDEMLTERLTGERAAFLGFQRDQNLLTREHFARFNEIVDLEPLMRHPQIAQVGLLGVYELVHKARLETYKAAEEKKREDAIRLDERTKVQSSMAQMPYPPVTGSGSGSPLDGLAASQKDTVVDAATAHYNRLQTERVGAA